MTHHSGDAMDGVYDNLWDVTVLEYAVSMHTRRGDQSRKKLALEKVNGMRNTTVSGKPCKRQHFKLIGRFTRSQYQQQPRDPGGKFGKQEVKVPPSDVQTLSLRHCAQPFRLLEHLRSTCDTLNS